MLSLSNTQLAPQVLHVTVTESAPSVSQSHVGVVSLISKNRESGTRQGKYIKTEKTGQSMGFHIVPAGEMIKPRHVHVHPCRRLRLARISPIPPARDRTAWNLGRRGAVLLNDSEDVQGECASNGDHQFISLRQASRTGPMRASARRSCWCCVRRRQTGCHREAAENLTLILTPHRPFRSRGVPTSWLGSERLRASRRATRRGQRGGGSRAGGACGLLWPGNKSP